jgi:excisionase family DNA binding protein
MSELVKNPFDLLMDQIRVVVREEIAAAGSGNGHALLTAEELAKVLKVNKATVYDWVKTNSIPYYQAGRFVRFNLSEVLQSKKNKNREPPLTSYAK